MIQQHAWRNFRVVLGVMTILTSAVYALPPVTNALLIALDGTDVTLSGSDVTSWNDQAALGGSEDFSGGVAPELISQAMPNSTTQDVVDFNGSADFLELGADSDMDMNTITWFIVTHSDVMPPSAAEVLFRSGYSSGAASAAGNNTLWGNFTVTSSKLVSHVRRADNSFTADGPVGTGGEWFILEAVWNGTGSTLNGNGAEEIMIRGIDESGSVAFNATYTGHDANPSGHIRTRLGKDADTSGRHYDGAIAEVLVYNTALSTTDRTNVTQYLVSKYFTSAPVPRTTPETPVTNNLLVALDGRDVTTSGSSVTRWRDQATLGGFEDFLPGDSPTLIAEAMPNSTTQNVVDLNGSADYLELSADSDMDLNTISWFIVTHSDVITDTDIILRSGYAGGAGGGVGDDTLWGSFTSGGASKFVSYVRDSSNGFTADGPVGVNGEWVLLVAVWNGTGSALNGNAAETILVRAVDDTGADAFDTTYTGRDASPSGHERTRIGKDTDLASTRLYKGGIAELLIYNTALSAADRASVETYLINKYFVAASADPTTIITFE